MPELTESTYINRSPEDVHRFTIEPANTMLWQSNLMEFQLLDDEPRKGSYLRGVSKVAGRRIDWEMEYAEIDIGHCCGPPTHHSIARSKKRLRSLEVAPGSPTIRQRNRFTVCSASWPTSS